MGYLINTIIRTLAHMGFMLAGLVSFFWTWLAHADLTGAFATLTICWVLAEIVGPLPDDRKALMKLLESKKA